MQISRKAKGPKVWLVVCVKNCFLQIHLAAPVGAMALTLKTYQPSKSS